MIRETKMQNILSRFSVKRIFSLFTFITICLLILVLSSAVKQYFLHQHCDMRVVSSQQLLFQLTGVKEHINEVLISHKTLNSKSLILEFQEVNGKLQNIFDDVLIPEEFKINFITQMDLVNITLTLREIENLSGNMKEEQIAILSTQLRSIHAKVDAFCQLINRYSQTQLMGLYKALVALLLVIIALVSMMLFIINHYISMPILRYCKSLSPDDPDGLSIFSLHRAIESLTTQTISAREQKDSPPEEQAQLQRYSLMGHLLEGFSHELIDISNGALNYSQAILDLSADAELDEDTQQLLKKLFVEEKKMSQLLTTLIRLNGCSEKSLTQNVTLNDFFTPIRSLTQGSVHNENVTFDFIPAAPCTVPRKYFCDVQLMILDILQSSKTPLFKGYALSSNEADQTIINISIPDTHLDEAGFSILITDNRTLPDSETDQAHTSLSQPPWDALLFWKMFLRGMGGTIKCLKSDTTTTLYTIHLPSTEKLST